MTLHLLDQEESRLSYSEASHLTPQPCRKIIKDLGILHSCMQVRSTVTRTLYAPLSKSLARGTCRL